MIQSKAKETHREIQKQPRQQIREKSSECQREYHGPRGVLTLFIQAKERKMSQTFL